MSTNNARNEPYITPNDPTLDKSINKSNGNQTSTVVPQDASIPGESTSSNDSAPNDILNPGTDKGQNRKSESPGMTSVHNNNFTRDKE